MYLQYRDLKLIQISGRLDDDNNDIMNGVYDNSEQPLTREERLKMIFSDWQNGDILVIADSPLKYPKKQGNTLVEMTKLEICQLLGDLTVLQEGEVFEDNKIKIIPKPDDIFELKWKYPNWIEGMSLEERTKEYHSMIDEIKSKLLELGYLFRGKRQKVRDNDKSWLSLRIQDMTIQAIKNKQITLEHELLVEKEELSKEGWVIDTGDVVFYDVFDLIEMLNNGSEWSSALFAAEQILKAKEPNKLITINDFRTEIGKLTSIECYIE